MAWFKRQSGDLDLSGEKKIRTEGLWVKCDNCRQIIWKKDLEDNLNVCPKCGRHFRIDARTRLAQLFDDGQYETFSQRLVSTDPLKFFDLKPYSERLKRAHPDAIVLHPGPINRGIEITPEVADGAQSCVLEQVTNGVAVRMAILYLVIAGASEGGAHPALEAKTSPSEESRKSKESANARD